MNAELLEDPPDVGLHGRFSEEELRSTSALKRPRARRLSTWVRAQ
jgi:hypothetical protein